MASKGDQIPQYRRVTLDSNGDSFVAQYTWSRYRFMFTDGAVMDVVAIRDDSDLRGAVLELHYGKTIKDPKDGGIAGVATLPELAETPEEAPEPRKTTRRVAKRTKAV